MLFPINPNAVPKTKKIKETLKLRRIEPLYFNSAWIRRIVLSSKSVKGISNLPFLIKPENLSFESVMVTNKILSSLIRPAQ